MDWRKRTYYCATFDYRANDYRMSVIKNIPGLRVHPNRPMPKQHDEITERGNYQYVLSVPVESAETLEYELRKAVRNDDFSKWKKIERVTKIDRL
jgi:hypothetical protein